MAQSHDQGPTGEDPSVDEVGGGAPRVGTPEGASTAPEAPAAAPGADDGTPADGNASDRKAGADGAGAAQTGADVDDRPEEDRPRTPSPFDVQLPVFEGPLDLMLHLVREHRLDIFDIPISFITEKYLEMIDKMRELNLDVAGEYLLMAATLAHIKSRMLLPRPEPEEDGEGAEDAGDPREELVRRLLEYQKYRDVAETLGGQDILGRDVFTRQAHPGPLPIPEGEVGLQEVSVFKLIESLDGVLKNAKVEVPHEVMRERISIGDRIGELVEVLRTRGGVGFLELFEGVLYKSGVITTFLALLEMARLGLARVYQESADTEIKVGPGERIEKADVGDVNDDFR